MFCWIIVYMLLLWQKTLKHTAIIWVSRYRSWVVCLTIHAIKSKLNRLKLMEYRCLFPVRKVYDLINWFKFLQIRCSNWLCVNWKFMEDVRDCSILYQDIHSIKKILNALFLVRVRSSEAVGWGLAQHHATLGRPVKISDMTITQRNAKLLKTNVILVRKWALPTFQHKISMIVVMNEETQPALQKICGSSSRALGLHTKAGHYIGHCQKCQYYPISNGPINIRTENNCMIFYKMVIMSPYFHN